MRFFTRSMIGVFLFALTLGLLALAWQMLSSAIEARLAGGGPAMPAAEREFSATVALAQPERVVPVMTVYGEVRSRRTLELRAPRAGKVVWLAEGFEDGAAVIAGQPLLRLDPAEAQASRDLARADLEKAAAELAEAERALEITREELAAAEARLALQRQALTRQRSLLESGVGAEATVETAAIAASSAEQTALSQRAALSQAESRVALARTALERQNITLAEAERNLDESVLRAGFAGRLNDVSVVEGRVVSGNERLGELIDPAALEVSFRLSTAQFARLMDAQGALIASPIRVSLDVSGAEVVATGRLSRVGAAVGTGQTGRLVYATLDAAPGLRPGDFVSVNIEEPALEAAFLLPATALGADGRLLVLGEDNRLEALPATVLRRQGDDVILHVEGLAGREVVTERSPLLGAGIRIRPVRPEAGAEAVPPTTVRLTEERRAALVAFVEANTRMPAEAKARTLAQLQQDDVPADVVARLEQRMGG